jgi:hypothetical protein
MLHVAEAMYANALYHRTPLKVIKRKTPQLKTPYNNINYRLKIMPWKCMKTNFKRII